MPGTTPLPIDYKPVRQFLAPFCDLSTIASLTLVNRAYRDAYIATESEPCMEHFGIGNWFKVKEIFLRLDSSLRKKVAANELRLQTAEQHMLPFALRQKIENNDLTVNQAIKILRNLNPNRNILDFLKDLDPEFEGNEFSMFDDALFTITQVNFLSQEIVRATNHYHKEIAAYIKRLYADHKNIAITEQYELTLKLCNEGIPPKEQFSNEEFQLLCQRFPIHFKKIAYTLAFQYARQTGAITKEMLLDDNMTISQLAILAANANLPADRHITQFSTLNHSSMLLNKNVLLALARGYLTVSDLDDYDDTGAMEYIISDMGFDLLAQTGSITELTENYSHQDFFEALYGVKLDDEQPAPSVVEDKPWVVPKNDFPINSYLDFLTSLTTKRCYQGEYLTPHQTFIYLEHYCHLYLLLSDIGKRSFAEKRVNFASAVQMAPSNLAKILNQSTQQFFSDRRHTDNATQQEYDRRFGLVVRPAQ